MGTTEPSSSASVSVIRQAYGKKILDSTQNRWKVGYLLHGGEPKAASGLLY